MQGTILGSRYRVIEYIAKGGFGKTFLAEDTQLPARNKCVVKQLFPSVDDPNFIKVARRLFKTEAETLNTLGVHDRIPRLMAYFEEDEKFYLVQQYIEGHTLSQELVAGKIWSEAKVVELLQDCLETLDFIHSKDVIHRDIKPDNLIRRQFDNKLVLVDFGTVKAVIAEQTQLVPATVAVGTRGYMPTEQARGKPRTTSDIYALGIIAIQALTGVHPTQLQEDDNGEIVWRDKAQCSLQLQEIVAKMTHYHFKDRYQSAKEAIAALDSLSGKPQPVATPQPSMEYTPTVQLSDSELARMSQRREPTAFEASSLSGDRSVFETPPNLTSFSAQPLENIAENAAPESSVIQANPASERENSMSNDSKSKKTLTTLGIAVFIGAIASGGMYFLNQKNLQSAQQSVTEQIASFQTMVEREDYRNCYEKINSLKTDDATNAMPLEKQQEFKAQCGLEMAKIEAEDLKYSEALAIAKTLPRKTAIDERIQGQIDVWSQQLLDKANQLYEREGDLAKAIETVKPIPDDSSIKSQVIDAKNFWKAEFQTNESVIRGAEKALSEEKWLYAKQQATKVKDSSASAYWQDRAKAIISQAEEGIGETTAETRTNNPVSNTPQVKNNPVGTPAIINKPNPKPTIIPNTTQPKAVTPQPEPKPTPRVSQDSSEPLRDLGGSSNSLPGMPSNSAGQDNAPLRDL